MAREMMFAEAIATAIGEEMHRDSDVVFYGQNMAMTDRDPFVKKFGKEPGAHHPDFGNGRAGHCGGSGADGTASHR